MLSISLVSTAQKDLKKANEFYSLAKYCEAIPYYSAYLNNYADNKAFVRRGWSYYHCNKLDSAIIDFENASLLEYDEPDLDYFVARTYQQTHDFEPAITYFKKYLASNLKKDEIRSSVVDEIKRCAQGLNLQYQINENIVENLGPGFNTESNEMNIIQSPNNSERYYFTRNTGQNGPSEIRYHLSNEANRDKSALLTENDALFDHGIVDIGQDGKYLLIKRYVPAKKHHLLYIDLFVPDSPPLSNLYVFDGPVHYENGDRDLAIVNDSTFIFSSKRAGGYGGYDIYITGKRNGFWFEPVNLGPNINSRYDEMSPFLSEDGNIIFYSSDRLESVGGFDIFYAAYNPENNQWEAGKNFGFPINSAGDELNFRLGPEGKTGYFSSDRKMGSYGKFDIYRSFFKIPFAIDKNYNYALSYLSSVSINPIYPARQQIPIDYRPPGYDQAFEDAANNITTNDTSFEDQIMEKFESWIDSNDPLTDKLKMTENGSSIPSLFYSVDSFVLKRHVNRRIIDKILEFLKKHPDYNIEFTSHCHPGPSKMEDLNLAMQVLLPMKNYFIENGISYDRVVLLSGGSFFPIARSAVNKKLQKTSEKYNNRIEIKLHSLNSENMIINSETYVVPHLKDGRWILYRSLSSGLSYKLKIVELTELRNAPYINHLTDCLVKKDDVIKKYIVYSGIFRRYEKALIAQKQLQAQNQISAEIIPFINGVPIDPTEALEKADVYLDLINYLESIK